MGTEKKRGNKEAQKGEVDDQGRQGRSEIHGRKRPCRPEGLFAENRQGQVGLVPDRRLSPVALPVSFSVSPFLSPLPEPATIIQPIG